MDHILERFVDCCWYNSKIEIVYNFGRKHKVMSLHTYKRKLPKRYFLKSERVRVIIQTTNTNLSVLCAGFTALFLLGARLHKNTQNNNNTIIRIPNILRVIDKR